MRVMHLEVNGLLQNDKVYLAWHMPFRQILAVSYIYAALSRMPLEINLFYLFIHIFYFRCNKQECSCQIKYLNQSNGGCGIIENIYLVFVLGSWHRDPKSLGISWVWGMLAISFFVKTWLWVGPQIASEWAQVAKKTNSWLEAWNFQSLPPQPLGR